MSTRVFIAILFLSFFALQSCFKIETYPPEPKIEFLDFIFVDTVDVLGNIVLEGTLHLYFEDGDGDVGFDTTTPRKNTIFLEKFIVVNGQEVLADVAIPLDYYVPKFENSNEVSTIKGEMFVNDLNEMMPFDSDTILYKFYIVDRAGHKSNVESTGYLVLK